MQIKLLRALNKISWRLEQMGVTFKKKYIHYAYVSYMESHPQRLKNSQKLNSFVKYRDANVIVLENVLPVF